MASLIRDRTVRESPVRRPATVSAHEPLLVHATAQAKGQNNKARNISVVEAVPMVLSGGGYRSGAINVASNSSNTRYRTRSIDHGENNRPPSRNRRSLRLLKYWAVVIMPALAVLLVLLRIVGSLVTLHQNGAALDRRFLDHTAPSLHLSAASSGHHSRTSPPPPPRFVAAHYSEASETNAIQHSREIQQERCTARTRRARPRPSLQPTSMHALPSPPRIRQGVNASTIYIDTNIIQYNWTLLCRAAGLSTSSSVVITRALTSQMGPALALLLKKQCGVHRITVVDAMVPNLRHVRIHAMKVHRQLARSIDELQLIVPFIGLARRVDGVQWLQDMDSISHVIHIDSTDAVALQYHLLKPYMSRRAQRSHHLQNALTSLQHILSYARARANAASPQPLNLLHVLEALPIVPAHSVNESYTCRTNHDSLAQGRRILADTYHQVTKGFTAFHSLQLPQLYGSNLVSPALEVLPADSNYMIPTDAAIAAILTALSHPKSGLHEFIAAKLVRHTNDRKLADHSRSIERDASSIQSLQTIAYNLDLQYPYGGQKHEPAVHYPEGAHNAIARVRDIYGIHKTKFPCAASCHGPTSLACAASPFDAIIPISVAATAKCKYVVYLIELTRDVTSLFQPGETGDDLCRLAFVSGNSQVVQTAMHKALGPTASKTAALQQYNGKLKSNGWTLIWLANDDESTLSAAEAVLAIMEPSRLFASSVVKAMFSATSVFAVPSDTALLRILDRMDRPAIPRHMRKEHRSGIVMSRFVPYPAERARIALLFASETPSEYQPQCLTEYAQMAKAANVTIPPKQIGYYDQVAHLVQSDLDRPEIESHTTSMHNPFPFQWISLGLVVHDLRLEAARTLRCNWYDEYLYWGDNRGAEELSLAYVLGMQRVEGRIGPGLAEDPTWIPLWDERSHRVGTKEGDAFLRIMSKSDQGF
jgi:hypothetical protein